MEMLYNEQTTMYTGWELRGTGVLGVRTGDRGLIHGDVEQ